MNKLIFFVFAFCFISSLTFAADENTVAFSGTIIDNLCANSQKPENLADFIKSHTKECALMPNDAASGYSIFSDGKLTAFDKESNAKIEEFLKRPESKLQVAVVARKVGDTLHLIAIENRK